MFINVDDKMIVVPEENEQLFQEFEEMGLVRKKHFRSLWDMLSMGTMTRNIEL